MSWERIRRTVRAVVAVASVAVFLVAVPGRHAHARTATGTVRWHVTLRGSAWGVAADARGAVAVLDDGAVTAVSPAGRARWTTRGVDVTEANPALAGSVVLVGGEAGVTALDRTTGAELWQVAMEGPVVAVGLSGGGSNGIAFAGGDAGTLTAFAARTGVVRWSVTRPGALWSAPRVDAATGAVVTTWHGGDQPHVEVLDLASGATRWSAPTAGAAAAPVLTGGGADAVVVVAAGDGRSTAAVEARDLGSGEVRWRTPVPASFERAVEPAAGRHDVVVVDHFGTVTALALADGRIRWMRALDEPVLAARIALVGPRAVVTTYAGNLIVLGRHDGRLVSAARPRDLGGYPVGGLAVRWGGRPGWCTGLRLGPATLALLRIP